MSAFRWSKGPGGDPRPEIPGPRPSPRPRPARPTLLAGLLAAASAVGAATPAPDLTELSLEALMDIEVTSVSKRPEKRSQAAAAIYVITPERIRRWGVTNVPDALRMVPGLQVARIDANKWAISSRGFNSRFANKLLVLIDGRSVYTPLFAGVYWEMQDLPLEDIERIEVIRGPGGTLWGANAVNGVVNIITRSARDSQGGLVSLTAGTGESIATVRHGGTLAPQTWYRAYARYRDEDQGYARQGAHDDWSLGQAGFRVDREGATDRLTVQGDYYQGRAGQQLTIPVDPPPARRTLTDTTHLSGANLLARWQRQLADGSTVMLQGYLDHVERNGRVLYENRNTVDVELQHDVFLQDHHRLVWGLGYRRTHDDTRGNDVFRLRPASRALDLFSAFAQLESALVPEALTLTLGTKLEHNELSGFEYQPNARLAWLPGEGHTLWGAVSRAVRTPSRGEHDVHLRILPAAPPRGVPWELQGDEDFESERLTAYEAGYRWQASERVSLDLAAFYNDYEALRTFDPEVLPPPVLGFPFDNRLEGSARGLEAALQWRPTPDWRIEGTYSYLDLDLRRVGGSRDVLSESAEQSSPRHQATLSSLVTLRPGLEWDSMLRYVDGIDTPRGGVPAYVALDLRLGIEVDSNLSISLAGRNLLDDHHPEFHPDFIETQGTEVERSVHVSLRWRF